MVIEQLAEKASYFNPGYIPRSEENISESTSKSDSISNTYEKFLKNAQRQFKLKFKKRKIFKLPYIFKKLRSKRKFSLYFNY